MRIRLNQLVVWMVLSASALACTSAVVTGGNAVGQDAGGDVSLQTDVTATDALADTGTGASDADATDADGDGEDAGVQDTGGQDTGAEDTGVQDSAATADAVDAKDVNTQPVGVPFAQITAPANGTIIEAGKPVALAGIATDTLYGPGELVVVWNSNVDGQLGLSTPDASGNVTLNLPKLSPGAHTISLTVQEPSGVSAVDVVSLGICSWGTPDTFDTAVTGGKWKTYGDAYFDAGGWLEMTGNAQSKKGAIFNIVDYVSPGDVQLSFKIATGGWLTSSGQPKGADGFALSVVDVKTVPELEYYIALAGAGGCLGYGVSGDCKQPSDPSYTVDAFHIEIDTWHNTGDPNYDPTLDNHIGIMQNGDASNHYLWASVPSIEDLKWHTVTVQITGNNVKMTLDGAEIINQQIPNFKFRGGFIGFSGTTGWATNYHRFDDLQILQQCLVQ